MVLQTISPVVFSLPYLLTIIIIILNSYKITHDPFTYPQILLHIQIPHLILPLAPHLYYIHIPHTFRVIDIHSSHFHFLSPELLQVLTSTSTTYYIQYTTHTSTTYYIQYITHNSTTYYIQYITHTSTTYYI